MSPDIRQFFSPASQEQIRGVLSAVEQATLNGQDQFNGNSRWASGSTGER